MQDPNYVGQSLELVANNTKISLFSYSMKKRYVLLLIIAYLPIQYSMRTLSHILL